MAKPRHQILIIEDEPLNADRAERFARAYFADAVEIWRAHDIEEATALLSERRYTLLLLDLNISGQDGFDLLRYFASYSAHTIVISAYDDRAIEAFEFGVIDFIAKPYDQPRFDKAMQRYASGQAEPISRLKFLVFRNGGRTDTVLIDDIAVIQAADKYSEVRLSDGEERFHDKSLGDLEQVLPPNFVRAHRSYILNVDAIAHLSAREGSRYFAVMKDNSEFPVSRSKVAQLRGYFA